MIHSNSQAQKNCFWLYPITLAIIGVLALISAANAAKSNVQTIADDLSTFPSGSTGSATWNGDWQIDEVFRNAVIADSATTGQIYVDATSGQLRLEPGPGQDGLTAPYIARQVLVDDTFIMRVVLTSSLNLDADDLFIIEGMVLDNPTLEIGERPVPAQWYEIARLTPQAGDISGTYTYLLSQQDNAWDKYAVRLRFDDGSSAATPGSQFVGVDEIWFYRDFFRQDVLDTVTEQVYNGNNSQPIANPWTSDWVENGDDDSPISGNILMPPFDYDPTTDVKTGTGRSALRFSTAGAGATITRTFQVIADVEVDGGQQCLGTDRVNFVGMRLTPNGLQAGDIFNVDFYDNVDATWVTLESFNGFIGSNGLSLSNGVPTQLLYEVKQDSTITNTAANGDSAFRLGFGAAASANATIDVGEIFYNCARAHYYDMFTTAAFSNSDGSRGWNFDWEEDNDVMAAPTPSGFIAHNGNGLRFYTGDQAQTYPKALRSFTIPGGNDYAYLSLVISETIGIDDSDLFDIELSTDGTTWTRIERLKKDIDAGGPVTRRYDLAAYIGQTIQVRLGIFHASEVASDEFAEWYTVDSVTIEYGNFTADPAGSPVLETYYVPLAEDDYHRMLTTIRPQETPNLCVYDEDLTAVDDPMASYISLVMTADAILYYDHWEDGLESNIIAPAQPSTEVWGDGNLTNGAAPGHPTDGPFAKGDVIVLEDLAFPEDYGNAIIFDGGDKIASTAGLLAVTRLGWSVGQEALFAAGFELYDPGRWGTAYTVPVGEDIYDVHALDTGAGSTASVRDNHSPRGLFEYVGASIQAGPGGASVNIDLDGDGAADLGPIALAEGESYLVNGGFQVGGTITSNTPVQVNLMAGDLCSNWSLRGFTLFPDNLLGSSYYNPVSTAHTGSAASVVWVHNPGVAAIAVSEETITNTVSFTVNPGETVERVVPENTATRYSSSGSEPFIALNTVAVPLGDGAGGWIGTENTTWDWGFNLLSDVILEDAIFAGYAPSYDPTVAPGDTDPASSPLWLGIVHPDAGLQTGIEICIDYNGNGGSLEKDGFSHDESRLVDELALTKLVSPTAGPNGTPPHGDLTGTIVVVCDDSNAKLLAAWGEEPIVSTGATPSIDIGTGVVPFATVRLGGELWFDEFQNGLYDRATESPLANVTVELYNDTQTPSVDTPIATTTSGSDGSYLFTVLPPGDYVVYIPNPPYDATAPAVNADNGTKDDSNGIQNTPGAPITSPIINVFFDQEPDVAVDGDDTNGDRTIDFGFYVDPSIDLEKMLNTPPTVTVGSQISFTIRITNTGSVTITNLPLTDTYDTDYLTYNTAADLVSPNPASEAANDGSILWNNVIDFDGDNRLAPQETLDIIVWFIAKAETTNLLGGTECESAGYTHNKASALGVESCVEVPIDRGEAKLPLGDLVWHDINGDGNQDANEPGIDGVLVNLYELDGTFTRLPTSLITTTTTTTGTGGSAISGFYEFTVISGKNYEIEIDASNFAAGGPLEGFIIASDQNDNQLLTIGDTVSNRIVPNLTTPNADQDFGYYCRFDLALEKQLAGGQSASVVAGEEVTFTLTIYNQGTVTATNVTIADYIPTGFTLNDGNWNGGPTGTVTQTLAATLTPSGTVGSSATMDIILTAGLALSGTYTNTAEIITYTSSITDVNGNSLPDADSTPDDTNGNGAGETTDLVDDELNQDGNNGGDEDDHDPAMITVTPLIPSVAVDKQFNGVGDVRVGETISFTIRITNTGDVTITTLPLEDRYNDAFLTYDNASIAPDPGSGNGILTWADLLSGDPNGLGISETVSVDVFFTTAADTTLLSAVAPCTESGHTPNLARSIGAMAGATPVIEDADDTSCDSVEILNPTAVALAERSVNQVPNGVQVRWSTESESDMAGFYILRSNGVESEMRSPDMIVAQKSGQSSGASYSWLDAGAMLRPGDVYILEVVYVDGSSERTVIDEVNERSIFMPMIMR